MDDCDWIEGLGGPYCKTHHTYTEDVGVCHVGDLEDMIHRVLDLCDDPLKTWRVDRVDPETGVRTVYRAVTTKDILDALSDAVWVAKDD